MGTVEDIYKKHRPTAFSADRRPSSAEVWWWFFMRVSGVVLVFLVLIHIYVVLLVGEGVERVNFEFISQRWGNVGWKTFDWLMLVLALLHGANGARVVAEDYVQSPGRRTLVKTLLYTATAILMVMGTAVLVTFDAGKAG
jgi:succinate dehydrogenase / fumarate reductase membrane anchor subunit